jgi:dihydroneopterin aldolase
VIGVIELRDLRVSAIIGVLAEERTRTQTLSIDLDLHRPIAAAAASDDVAATTNYAEIITLVSRVSVEGHFQLLEALAGAVADAVFAADHEIVALSVLVRKVHPPVNEDVASVGVRLTVERP